MLNRMSLKQKEKIYIYNITSINYIKKIIIYILQ